MGCTTTAMLPLVVVPVSSVMSSIRRKRAFSYFKCTVTAPAHIAAFCTVIAQLEFGQTGFHGFQYDAIIAWGGQYLQGFFQIDVAGPAPFAFAEKMHFHIVTIWQFLRQIDPIGRWQSFPTSGDVKGHTDILGLVLFHPVFSWEFLLDFARCAHDYVAIVGSSAVLIFDDARRHGGVAGHDLGVGILYVGQGRDTTLEAQACAVGLELGTVFGYRGNKLFGSHDSI